MPKELDTISFPLCDAIQNGIKNEQGYPRAYIEQNGALSIECVDDIKGFQSLATIFPELCEQHQIARLPGAETYSAWSDGLSKQGKPQCKITFNITPDDFDRLLMIESRAYQGYRNSSGSGSILLLADPLRDAYKEGVICAFPVLLLENNSLVMLRTAGCNSSEALSTQLSYLVTQYLPAETYKNLSKRYGHWGSELTQCIMDELSGENLLQIALNCVSNTNEPFYIQNMEGFDCLQLHEQGTKWLQKMNPEAENIYRLLGAASPAELAQLMSLEIPAELFLQGLYDFIKSRLNDFEPGGQYGPGGKYYYPDNEKYNLIHCEKLKKNLLNLETILAKIKDMKPAEIASPQNLYGFFQSNAEATSDTDRVPTNSIKF